MADPFEGHSTGLTGSGMRHYQIAPSNVADLPIRPRLIYCAAAGTIVIRDELGVELPYTCEAGDRIEFRGMRVMATGTSGTWYGWY